MTLVDNLVITLVGFAVGFGVIPIIIFAFGGMGLPSFGRIMFTIIQLTGSGSVLWQVDDNPTYELRPVADLEGAGHPTHVYVGESADTTGSDHTGFLSLDSETWYRLGKKAFGLSFDPNADWIDRYRIHRQTTTDGGGDILTGEERGEMPLWSPWSDTTGSVVVDLTRLSVFRGDFESLREVVRRTLPEAGDRSTISELFLIILSAVLFVFVFAVTLVLF